MGTIVAGLQFSLDQSCPPYPPSRRSGRHLVGQVSYLPTRSGLSLNRSDVIPTLTKQLVEISPKTTRLTEPLVVALPFPLSDFSLKVQDRQSLDTQWSPFRRSSVKRVGLPSPLPPGRSVPTKLFIYSIIHRGLLSSHSPHAWRLSEPVSKRIVYIPRIVFWHSPWRLQTKKKKFMLDNTRFSKSVYPVSLGVPFSPRVGTRPARSYCHTCSLRLCVWP